MCAPVCDVVVDLGCGPAADRRAFAAAVGGSGQVIGVDNDLAAIERAARTHG